MRVIELDSLKECTSWGVQGESGATTLVINVSDFLALGHGKAVVIFQRQDGHPYIHNFTLEGENLFITLTSIDTQLVGKCELSISWIANTKIIKKKNYHSFILPSALEGDLPLTEEAIMALDNLKQYTDEIKKLVAEAQQYAAELIFINKLPTDGESGKLYIEESTSTVYFWDEKTHKFISTSNAFTGNFDFICGGSARDF